MWRRKAMHLLPQLHLFVLTVVFILAGITLLTDKTEGLHCYTCTANTSGVNGAGDDHNYEACKNGQPSEVLECPEGYCSTQFFLNPDSPEDRMIRKGCGLEKDVSDCIKQTFHQEVDHDESSTTHSPTVTIFTLHLNGAQKNDTILQKINDCLKLDNKTIETESLMNFNETTMQLQNIVICSTPNCNGPSQNQADLERSQNGEIRKCYECKGASCNSVVPSTPTVECPSGYCAYYQVKKTEAERRCASAEEGKCSSADLFGDEKGCVDHMNETAFLNCTHQNRARLWPFHTEPMNETETIPKHSDNRLPGTLCICNHDLCNNNGAVPAGGLMVTDFLRNGILIVFSFIGTSWLD